MHKNIKKYIPNNFLFQNFNIPRSSKIILAKKKVIDCVPYPKGIMINKILMNLIHQNDNFPMSIFT